MKRTPWTDRQLADALSTLSERLADLAEDVWINPKGKRPQHERVTMRPEVSDRLRDLIGSMDNLIGEIRDLDQQAREEAAREYADDAISQRRTKGQVI